MSRQLSNILTLLLALIGAFIALTLTYRHFNPDFSLGCGVSQGCGSVLSSAYSKVGPIPTSLFGFGMYAAIFGLCLARRKKLAALNLAEKRRADSYANALATAKADTELAAANLEEGAPRPEVNVPEPAPVNYKGEIGNLNGVLWGLSLLGVLISYGLQYNSLFVLKSICPWCLSSASVITGIFLLASKDFWLEGRVLNSEQKLLLGVSSVVLGVGIFMYAPKIYFSIEPPKSSRQKQREFAVEKFINTALRPGLVAKGAKDAPLTIVEWADYQCPACAASSEEVERLLEEYPKDFRLVFRNYPLPKEDHQWSPFAAAAAEAANDQGKFWEMHKLIFSRQAQMTQNNFTPDVFDAWAKELNLDVTKFREARNSERIRNLIVEDKSAADAGELQSTPTFYVIRGNQAWRFQGIQELLRGVKYKEHPMWKATSAETKTGG